MAKRKRTNVTPKPELIPEVIRPIFDRIVKDAQGIVAKARQTRALLQIRPRGRGR